MSIFKPKNYVTYSALRAEVRMLEHTIAKLKQENHDSKITIDLILHHLALDSVVSRNNSRVPYLVEVDE